MITSSSNNDGDSHPLTETDREILQLYQPITKAIGQVFGSCCEVTLHSVEDPSSSIISIMHGEITGRNVGSPLTDLALSILVRASLTNEEVIGPYFSTTESGKQLRSVTTLIRNHEHELIGFLCINLDLSAPLLSFMDALMPTQTDLASGNLSENFSNNVGGLVHNAFVKALTRISQTTGVAPIEKNRMIVQELQNLGIFNVKGAIDTVAGELGVSKYTVYNYLREIKGRGAEQEKQND